MIPFKTILTPTDFSEPAKLGLETAKALAQRDGAEVILIHVVAPVRAIPPSGPAAHSGFELSAVMKELEDAAGNSLEEMVERVTSEGIKARSLLVQGSPAEEIASAAEREDTDVIVIATHGWTGWRRFVFGSVAERVVRLSRRPVLTVPAPHEAKEKD